METLIKDGDDDAGECEDGALDRVSTPLELDMTATYETSIDEDGTCRARSRAATKGITHATHHIHICRRTRYR